VTPPGTVTFRQDRTTAFDANALAWTLTPFQPPSASACTGLVSNVGETSLFPANVAIITAVFAPATAASGNTPAVPEHCNLAGTIRAGRVGEQSSPGVTQTYAIKWQVRLPTTWNGRYVHEGGGGLDGSVPATTSRLAAGYAQGGDDSGHDNAVNNDPLAAGTGAFGTDPQARTDFFYQAITDTTTVARGLQTLYYNKLPDKAYFEGCSMGGREAMMATQRLGQYYDGVVVGDPGFRLPLNAVQVTANVKALAQLANSMGLVSSTGAPLLNNTFTNQDLQLVSKAVLHACDATDGLVDGMVNKPLMCTTPVVAPVLMRYRTNPNVQGFIKGAYAAAIGTILGACALLGRIAIGDWLTALVALASLVVLFRWKVSNPLLIACAAVIGLVAYPLLQPGWVFVK